MKDDRYIGYLAQREANANQNKSFTNDPYDPLLEKIRREQLLKLDPNNLKDFIYAELLDGKHKQEFQDRLVQLVNYSRFKEESINGKVGDVAFFVKSEDPLEIIFTDYYSNSFVTISEKGIYSEIALNCSSVNLHFFSPRKCNQPIVLTRKVFVVDSEEINEYLNIELGRANKRSFNGFYYNEPDKEAYIAQEFLKLHPEFSQGEKKTEFYRLNVSPTSKVPRLYDKTVKKGTMGPFLCESAYDKELNERAYYREDLKTYQEYINLAKEFENNCKYIYDALKEVLLNLQNEKKGRK